MSAVYALFGVVLIPVSFAAIRLAKNLIHPVVFTRHGPLLADGSDMIARRRRRDSDALELTSAPALWHSGTFEHEVLAELTPREGELVVEKKLFCDL